MFVSHEDILCVTAQWLYTEAELFTKDLYFKLCKRGKIKRVVKGGNGRKALIAYDSLPEKYRTRIEEILGYDPKKKHRKQRLERYIVRIEEARQYYLEYRKADGTALGAKKADRYALNAEILRGMETCEKETKAYRKSRGNSTRGVWDGIVAELNRLDPAEYPHSLPSNGRTIKNRIKLLRDNGYGALVHGQHGNANRAKIVGDVADWILAQYCLPKKYTVPEVMNIYAAKQQLTEGWQPISNTAVKDYLNRPEIRRIWFLKRHGREAWMNEYGHTLKRGKDNWFPNCYWVIDGTKLDWMHYTEDGNKMASKLRFDIVVDMYSEKILGWSYSETENHKDHFKSFKMAVNTAGHKPYLITYDNQSGHKMKGMQALYDNLVASGGTHYPHKAYKHSNPIEQVIGRFQRQVISKYWFSDKQSITSRLLDSRPNMDFIQSNKHRLKTMEELEQSWATAVAEWNSMKHPKHEQSRNEVYAHKMEMCEPVDELDAMSLFMVEATKGNTYKKDGIKIVVAKELHEYEVYDEAGAVDMEFRRYNIGNKFKVKYDPTNLDTYVALHDVDTDAFVAYAEPKRAHESVPALMKDGDNELLRQDMDVVNRELADVMQQLEDLEKRTGITEDAMIVADEWKIKMGGRLPKKERNEVEASSFDRL